MVCQLEEVVTPVIPNRLASYLHGYDTNLKTFLIHGFSKGFSINYQGPTFSNFSKNHASVFQLQSVVSDMLQKELSHRRIAGPFSCAPFPNFIVSPLGVVPKKEEGKYRLIHDLSFPSDSSVNSFIDPVMAAVQYETLDRVVELVQKFGHNCLMAKCDIQEAFRIIPVLPADRFLLGFAFKGQYYFDKCLPMGCRMSCSIFESFSSALQWVATNKLGVAGISHILDDFIFVGPANSSNVDSDLKKFLKMCKNCAIPIKQSKTVLPTTTIVAHGIEVDSQKMMLLLPQDKVKGCVDMLEKYKIRKRVTLRELQSLIGSLSFACRVVRPGRAFLRRLIDLTTKVNVQHHHIKLSAQARADLNAWHLFLRSFNGCSVFLNNVWLDSDQIKLFSDASGSIGFGAVFGSKWLCGNWPPLLAPLHITFKELFPIVLCLEIWGPALKNHKILFKTDNAAVAAIINKQSSKDPKIMLLVRRLVLAGLKFNILFRSQHIPGFSNTIPDLISRFRLQEVKAIAPWLDPQPTEVPLSLFSLT